MATLRRWLVRALFALALLGLVAVGAVALVGHTGVGEEFLRAQLIRLLTETTTATVTIGRSSATIGHTLVLEDVRVAVDGRTVATLPRVELVYALLPLFRSRIEVEEVRLERPQIRAVETARGWRLPGLRTSGGGGHFTVVLDAIRIDGGRIAVARRAAGGPRLVAATDLALRAAAELGPAGTRLRIGSLAFVPRGAALGPVHVALDVRQDARGAVELAHATLATPRTRVAVAGTLAPGRDVALQARLAPLAAADVRAVAPATGLRADVRTGLRIDGPWEAIVVDARTRLDPGGRLAVHATVDAAAEPPRLDGTLRFHGLDPSAVMGGLPAASATGQLDTHGALAARGPFDWRLAVRHSTVAGQDVDELDADGRAAAGVHRVRARARAPLGDASVHARVALATPPAYRADARFTLARLDLLAPSTWGWAVGHARVRGDGIDAADRHATASVRLAPASVHGVPLDRAAVDVRLDGPQLIIGRAEVVGPELQLSASGDARLEATRALDVALQATADLAGIGARVGRPLAGRAELTARARGPLDALGARATLAVAQPAWAALSADGVRLDATASGLGGATASADATLDVDDGRLGTRPPHPLHASVAWRRAAGVDRADAHAVLRGTQGAEQEIGLTVERARDATRGRVDTLTLTPPDGPAWRLARPATFTLADALTVDLALGANRQRATLAGRIAVRDGGNDARLRLEQIALGPLCAAGGLPPCGGRLDADVALRGSASAPAAHAAVRGAALRVQQVEYGALTMDVDYADLRARLDATLRHPVGGTLTAAGTVPVDLAWSGTRHDLSEAPVDVAVRAAAVDLTVLTALAPSAVREATGHLDADVRVGGPRAAPVVQGTLAIPDARLLLAATGVAWEHVHVEVRATGGRIEVTTLHAETGDGRLDGRGTVLVARGQETAIDLSLRLATFHAVEQQAYDATLSGDATATGTLAAPVVHAALRVDRAEVRPARLPSSGTTTTAAPDPTITVVGEPAVAPVESAPGFPERVALDVTVRIEHDTWIRRADADIELAGGLHVQKPAGDPAQIVGGIRLVRGWYAFQGRRFTVDHGSIGFTGGTPVDPVVDVTARYRTSQYDIEVRITGPLSKPTLELSSEPPLEQADILSVLLFGNPTNQLGHSQSVALQQQALALAAGYAMPELRTSVMNALGVDTLEVQMPEGTTEPGAVRVGRYVAEDVFVSLAQEFGPRTAEVVGLEYYLTRRVSVRGQTSSRGDSGIDLIWHWLY